MTALADATPRPRSRNARPRLWYLPLAAEPQEAFLLAMGDQLDVVLMNVDLQGGHDGIQAARWLREVSDAPIVFVTGYTDRDTIERIHQQVPGAPVLPKPIYRDQLAKALGEVVEAEPSPEAC